MTNSKEPRNQQLDAVTKPFIDADVIVEECIWLANVGNSGHCPDGLEDMITEYPEKLVELLGLSEYIDDLEELDRDMLPELIAEKRLNGFLMQAHTPVKKFYADNPNRCSYSWGHCRFKWFYFEDLTQAAVTMAAWSKEVESESRAEALARNEPDHA